MQREPTVRQQDLPRGASSHGASSHGASSHGAVSHGASTHGAATRGPVPQSASAHGTLPNGAASHGAASHGAAPHGGSLHGAPANPLVILERAQALLEEQRAELARWIADLESVHGGLSRPGQADGGALEAENEDLRRRICLLESALAEPVSSKEADELRAQTEL